MPKTLAPKPGSTKHRELTNKLHAVDVFAWENRDRNATFRYAQSLGLPSSEIGKAVARNFQLNGKYDPPTAQEDNR